MGITFCPECGNHLKPKYEYLDEYGDDGFCYKCECGLRFHMWRRVGP